MEKGSDVSPPAWVVPPGRGRLEGKVAVVTGAGSQGPGIGNGRAIAILMALHGARVGLVDRDPEAAALTAAMIAEAGGEALALTADVTEAAECAGAVAATVERYGGLDVLVNNVGMTGAPLNALAVEPAEWENGLALNVTSFMLMAKHAVPAMEAAGGGAIVNISSLSGLLGGYPGLLYPTSKGAVVNMTRAMAAHHGAAGIRVNCVAPGKVFTPLIEADGVTAEMREHRRKQSVLGTEGTGWDVGLAALFLASDEARWITGVVLPVDAGASATQQAGASWPGAAED
jgi:NAD(P)-dependent dehydrogenase (short-subunit alcohol dehydrogenase family)